jgi:hypothetical protein
LEPIPFRLMGTPTQVLVADGIIPALMGVTAKVVLGPAARALLPAASVAVLAAILIPTGPLPEIPLSVTVRVLVPVTETATFTPTVPEAFTVTSEFDNEMAVAPTYVMV